MVDIEDGTKYSVERPAEWQSLMVPRGCIVEALVPGSTISMPPFCWKSKAYRLHPCRNYERAVKHVSTGREVFFSFVRRRGLLGGHRQWAPYQGLKGVFQAFFKSYMTHYVKNQIKIWLPNAGLLDAEEDRPPGRASAAPAAPAAGHGAEEDEKGGAKVPREGWVRRSRGDHEGVASKRTSTEDMENKRKELRERLESPGRRWRLA